MELHDRVKLVKVHHLQPVIVRAMLGREGEIVAKNGPKVKVRFGQAVVGLWVREHQLEKLA